MDTLGIRICIYVCMYIHIVYMNTGLGGCLLKTDLFDWPPTSEVQSLIPALSARDSARNIGPDAIDAQDHTKIKLHTTLTKRARTSPAHTRPPPCIGRRARRRRCACGRRTSAASRPRRSATPARIRRAPTVIRARGAARAASRAGARSPGNFRRQKQ